MSVSAHVMEHHKSHRIPWLRAAVLGANDGIVSIAGLVIGVAAASSLAFGGCDRGNRGLDRRRDVDGRG